MLPKHLVEEWLAIVDDGAVRVAQLRQGNVTTTSLLSTSAIANRANAWFTEAGSFVMLVAETSLAEAYAARRDFDRKKRVLAALLEELRDLVKAVK